MAIKTSGRPSEWHMAERDKQPNAALGLTRSSNNSELDCLQRHGLVIPAEQSNRPGWARFASLCCTVITTTFSDVTSSSRAPHSTHRQYESEKVRIIPAAWTQSAPSGRDVQQQHTCLGWWTRGSSWAVDGKLVCLWCSGKWWKSESVDLCLGCATRPEHI